MYNSGLEIPKVAFSLLNPNRITPGSYFTGFDLDNLGKLSKMDHLGQITVIEGGGSSTGLTLTTYGTQGEATLVNGVLNIPIYSDEINEFSITLSSDDILNMNHERFVLPDGGIEILPSPGEGLAYSLELGGILFSYDSNGEEGYCADRYGEFRSLDIYYHSSGQSFHVNNQRIISIPITSDPFSEWLDRANPNVPGQLFFMYNGQESLRIDGSLDTAVYQQLSVNQNSSGFSYVSINDNAIYVGTNGLLQKIKESSSGTITIKLWYRVLDISEVVPVYTLSESDQKYSISNPLPDIANPHSYFKRDYYYVNGLNFLDIPSRQPSYSFWDNFPSRRSIGSSPNAEDYLTQYRARRDEYIKTLNEYILYRWVGMDDVNFGYYKTVGFYDVMLPPYPMPGYQMAYDNFPMYFGAKLSVYGITGINENWIRSRESVNVKSDGITYVNNLPYPPVGGDFIQSGYLNSPYAGYDTLIYSSETTRISELTIDSPGTGYAIGDLITFNDPIGSQAVGKIVRVGTNGEILEVCFVDRHEHPTIYYAAGAYILGGRDYSNNPTVTIHSSSGVDAILTPIISTGQWLIEEEYLVETDYGIAGLSDIMTTKRATRDAFTKAVNELILSIEPVVHANFSIPKFVLEKYHL